MDAEGAPSTQLACPRCRLQIPRASLEMPSVVLSVLGAPGSGKSVFLTSMVFTIRQQAARLGLRFQDTDLVMNKHLIEDERRMFLDSEGRDFSSDRFSRRENVRGRSSLSDFLDRRPSGVVCATIYISAWSIGGASSI